MNNGVQTRRYVVKHSPHRLAADHMCVGQLRDVACDFFLQKLEPKFTPPRRTAGKQLVKDYEEPSSTALAKLTQSSRQRKRQPTFFVAVVHVMQDQVRRLLR